MGFIQWVIRLAGGGEKVEEVNIESEIERQYAKGILLAIEGLSRKIGASGEEEKEYKPIVGMKKIDIAIRLKVLFSKLKKLERMQKLSIKTMIDSMKSRMDPLARNDLDFDLKIERKMETETLSLESFLDSMLAHFEATGDRRYAYNFLSTAAKALRGELKEEAEKKKLFERSAA